MKFQPTQIVLCASPSGRCVFADDLGVCTDSCWYRDKLRDIDLDQQRDEEGPDDD